MLIKRSPSFEKTFRKLVKIQFKNENDQRYVTSKTEIGIYQKLNVLTAEIDIDRLNSLSEKQSSGIYSILHQLMINDEVISGILIIGV